MAKRSFTDLLIVTLTSDDHFEDITIPEHDCDLLALKHFQKVAAERIERNEQIYSHVSHLKSRNHSNNYEKITKNPFPDNDCKLAFFKVLKYDGLLLQFASNELRNDRDVVLRAVKENAGSIEVVSEELRSDREFVEKVVMIAKDRTSLSTKSFFKFLDKFHDDELIVRKVVEKHVNSLEFVSPRLRNDRVIVWNAVKRNGSSLQFVPEHLKDRELVMLAVKTDSQALLFAPIEFLKDKEIISRAAKLSGLAIKYAHTELKNDREFALEMVKLRGLGYNYLSEDLRGDREIALAAIKSMTTCLRMAPNHIKDDFEIVSIAVTKNLSALMFSSQRFKDDTDFIYNCASTASQIIYFLNNHESLLVTNRDFCLRLIEKSCGYDCFRNARDFVKLDKELCLKFIQIYPDCLEDVKCEDILNDKQLLMDLLPHSEKILLQIPNELCNDRELMMWASKIHDNALKFASEELCADREFVNEALLCDFGNFEYLSEELRSDRELVENIVKIDGFNVQFVPELFRNNRELIITSIRNAFSDISPYLGYQLKEDRDIILESVKRSGIIENLLHEFRDDREIVMMGIQQFGPEFRYASKFLRSDRELALIAIRNLCTLEHIPKEILDRKLAYEACKRSAFNLKFASEYRDDELIVLSALSNENGGLYTKYVGERLKNDRDFILKASKLQPSIIAHISTELLQDREIIINALSHDGNVLAHLPEEFKSCREYVEIAANSNPHSLKYASEDLKQDPELLYKAIATGIANSLVSEQFLEDADESTIQKCIENGVSLRSFPKSLTSNRNLVIKAVNINMENLRYASKDLINKELVMEISPKNFDILLLPIKWRSDKDIALKALEMNGKSIIYISDELKNEFKHNKEILLKAMKTDSIPFLYASDDLQNDRDFILESVSTNGLVLRYVASHYKEDREVVLKAVKNHGNSIRYGARHFMNDREIMWNAVQNLGAKILPCNPLIYGSFEIRSDRELVLEAVRHDYHSLEYVVIELLSDEEFMTKCVEININSLIYAHYQLRYNVDFLKRLNKTDMIREDTDLHNKIDIEGLLGYNPKLKDLNIIDRAEI